MPSDLYTLDISFDTHSSPSPSPDMVSYEYDASGGDLLFYSHPFLKDSPIHVTQANSNNSLDPFSPSFFSFSPLQNELLYQPNSLHLLPSGLNIKGECGNLSALDGPEVITEECQMGVDYSYNHRFLSQSSCVTESASNLMQRSFSCNSFDGKPFQPHLDSPNFQRHAFKNTFFNGEVRRVCSTGDLQNMKATDMSQKESPLLEEANFKVGRYSAEVRKEKISKYRAKRSQRKFNKTIKYACRKTLADNRTRIRGRFARNDETTEIPKAPCSSSTAEECEDEFWVEFIGGLNEEPRV